jgi:hypothetical protein
MNAHQIDSYQASAALIEELDRRIGERFPEHPLRNGVTKDNFEAVAAQYLAMSIAFPFIQAGAIHETYKAALRARDDTDKNSEITAAVGAFLTWDEFGGHNLTLTKGNKGLLQLTATHSNYHAHWLRQDIRTILGKDVRPNRSEATARYLDELLDGLSDARRNRNVAYMIGFECHAEGMIKALWDAVCSSFDLPQDEGLVYFWGHVGGPSPAESVHVEMTRMMVAELVPPDKREEFIELCLEGYALNYHWCEAIASSPIRKVSEPSGRGDRVAPACA